jgi:hypothetical protein
MNTKKDISRILPSIFPLWLLLLFLAGICPVTLFPQVDAQVILPDQYSFYTFNANRSDSFSLAGKQYLYSADSTGGWQLEIYSTYGYRENGLLDTNVNYYQEGGDPFNRVTYSYDMFGRNTLITIEKYDSNYTNTSRFEYAYDEYDNPTEEYTLIWFSNDWKIASGRRKTYEYDANVNIISITKEVFNVLQGWLPDERSEYLLDSEGEAEEIITYDWLAFQWTRLSRLRDIDWQNYDGNHATGEFLYYQEDKDNSGEWEPELRRNYSYFQNGSYEFTEESFLGEGNWAPKLKYEELRNAQGWTEEEKTSVWFEDQWIQKEGSRYSYSIDGIDLTEVIIQIWDTLLADYINSEKIVFSDFLHFQHIPESGYTSYPLKIYPNPADEYVYFDLEGIKADAAILMDSQGRIVLSQTIMPVGEIARLDISGMVKGVYFLIILKEKRRWSVGKVVKM